MITSQRSEIDEATTAAAKAGDREAAGRMLADVEPIILRQIGRAVQGDRRDDCAQELRMQVLRSIQRFDRSKSNWRTFVARRVPTLLIDFFRVDHAAGQYNRKIGWRSWTVPASSLDQTGGDAHFPTEIEPAAHDDDLYDTVELLDTLEASPTLRSLGLYLRGWTMREIAVQLGVSESLVGLQIAKTKVEPGLRHRIALLAGIDDPGPSDTTRNA